MYIKGHNSIKEQDVKPILDASIHRYQQKLKFLKLFGNDSYMSVNADIKYWLHILLFDGVTTLNVH